MASVNQKLLGVKFTDVDDTQKHELGLEVDGIDGNRYKYIRAGAAIAVGDALKVDYAEGPNDLDPISAVSQAIAALAPVAIADNKFGFVVIQGFLAGVKMAGSTAAGAKLGSSATAATLVTITATTPTAAEVIAAIAAAAGRGVICTVAESAGVGTAYIN